MKGAWSWWDTLFGSIVLIMIALVTASATPVAGAVSPRACDLLVLADVTGLLGSGFAARQDVALTGGPTMSTCAFHKSGGSVVIQLHQLISDAAQALQQEQAMPLPRGVTVTPVNGLGAGAFYFQGPNAGSTPGLFQLHFGKGRRLVTLAVTTGGRPDLQATQQLAAIAYARLP